MARIVVITATQFPAERARMPEKSPRVGRPIPIDRLQVLVAIS